MTPSQANQRDPQQHAAEVAFLTRLPKAELHVHLEGSTQPETLLALGREHGVAYPFTDAASARAWFRFRDFPHFIDIYDAICDGLLRGSDYGRVAWELAQQAQAQQVRYLEVIFSPTTVSNPRTPATPDEVMPHLRAVRARALAELGVELQYSLDVVRGRSVADVQELVDWACAHRGDGLVGINLGGPEVGNPARVYRDQLRQARDAGLRLSLHAGETVGPESVWDALECGAERIGHGVRSVEDPALVAHLVQHGIVLEVSPTSNVCLGVAPSIAEHQMRELVDAGVRVTLNSDDPPMFETTLLDEYLALHAHGFSIDELATMARTGFDAAFVPDDQRQTACARFDVEVAALRAELGLPSATGG